MADANQGSAASITTNVLPAAGEDKYRIALAHPDDAHPNSAAFSWRKLYAFNPDFHDPGWDAAAAAFADLPVAESEFPGHQAWVEQLVANGDGTHSWVTVDPALED